MDIGHGHKYGRGHKYSTVKPLNSGHLRVLKNLSVIKSCPLLGGCINKIVTFWTKHFVRYSRYVCYLRCLLLGGFTVQINFLSIMIVICIKQHLCNF